MAGLPKSNFKLFGNYKNSRYSQPVERNPIWYVLGAAAVVLIIIAVIVCVILLRKPKVIGNVSGENTQNAWQWKWEKQKDSSLLLTVTGESKAGFEWSTDTSSTYFIQIDTAESNVTESEGKDVYAWKLTPKQEGSTTIIFSYSSIGGSSAATTTIVGDFYSKGDYITVSSFSYIESEDLQTTNGNTEITWQENESVVALFLHDDGYWSVARSDEKNLCTSGPGRSTDSQVVEVWAKEEGVYSLILCNEQTRETCTVTLLAEKNELGEGKILISVMELEWGEKEAQEIVSIEDIISEETESTLEETTEMQSGDIGN